MRIRARTDLDKAALWYESQQAGISRNFLATVEKAFDRIESNPYVCQVYYKKFRQIITVGYPYRILYFIIGRKVFVARIFHFNQDFTKDI